MINKKLNEVKPAIKVKVLIESIKTGKGKLLLSLCSCTHNVLDNNVFIVAYNHTRNH